MRRGEIWWAKLAPPVGKRPVLLLSRDEAYAVRELVTVAPVTTRIRHIASEVSLGPEEGLTRRCGALLCAWIGGIKENRGLNRLF